MIKYLAVFIAAILALSLVTSAAYAQTQNATSLQIQIVPQIQRGHQQHLTIFAVDDQGNQVNGSGEIISSIENERGVLVGPKTVYTETGEDVSYKVGPNTRPQNISVNSCLTDSEICAAQSYYVFPKGMAQVPAPPVPEPEIPTAIPIPEEPELEVPINDTDDGEIVIPANETEVTLPENGTDVTINDTGEAEPLPPILNETTEPVPFPPQNETQLPPVTNETAELTPVPPVEAGNETIPIEGNVTIEPVPLPGINETGENETTTELPTGNETIPIEGNVTIPDLPVGNETQNATVEEPVPFPPINGNGQTPNGTTPTEPGVTPTEPPVFEEPELNATEAFNQLENATAVQDQQLDDVRDNGNDTSRAELKALVGETAGAIGDVAPVVVNATNEELQILQNSAASMSESIDEILNPNEAEDE